MTPITKGSQRLFTRFRRPRLPSYSTSLTHGVPPPPIGEHSIAAGGSTLHSGSREISGSASLQGDQKDPNAPSEGVGISGASPETNSFRRRRVVTSFLCHGNLATADFRVSAFKRSAMVRTYPGKWAGCSGSVESTDVSPVRAALRELLEETGLAQEQLVRIGGGGGPLDANGEEGFVEGAVKYELRDEHMRTIWEVWPFLWRVLADEGSSELELEEIRAKVCLDWENDEIRFVTLDEMKEMNTVEDLGRGVRVVLASLNKAGSERRELIQ